MTHRSLSLAGAALCALAALSPTLALADEVILAGGCFWSVENNLDHVEGVTSTVSGYIGGSLDNPTYQDVITETTGHYEAVRVTFDPARVSYDQVLQAFWHSIDPTDAGGQFCDRGPSYRTAVFTTSAAQKAGAETSAKAIAAELGKPVATAIMPAPKFYPAEDYHQNYARENPVRYNSYRIGCGRDAQLKAVWGDKAFLGIKDKLG